MSAEPEQEADPITDGARLSATSPAN